MRGFSLLELLVVCVLCSVLLGGAALALQDLRQRPLEREAQDLLTTIEHAAALAVLQRRDIVMSYNSSAHQLEYQTVDAPGRFRPYTLPAAIDYRGRFGNLGRAPEMLSLHDDGTATPGTITLIRGSDSCRIVQSLRGSRTLRCP